jgi:stress-induced morphogen
MRSEAMEKIIKFTIENTTKTREVEDTYSELYSHDRNNGLFEFEIANEQLAGKNLIALFKFVKTGSYWKTEAVVEDNKAKIKFDTSLITQNEKVICFIYVNEEIRDADIFRFKFNVRVSEIDKAKQLPLKERFHAHGLIVDRVDVLTKEDFDNAIKEIEKGSKFLTEAQANEKYALKSDIPNITNLATTTELEKRALKTEIPSTETIVNKAVEKVEKKGYLTQHQSLAGYITEAQLEGKNYLTQHQSLNGYVTETQLNEKGYLTQHQDISGLATKKAVEAVENKVTQLENRPVTSSYDDSEIKRKLKELEDRPTTANIDTSNFVTTTQLEDKHYLTEHQDISGLATKEQLRKAFLDDEEHEIYAKKTELPQPYNDTDIKSRLTTLENRPAGSGEVDLSNCVKRDELFRLSYATTRETDEIKSRIVTLENRKSEGGVASSEISEIKRQLNITYDKFETPFKSTGLKRVEDYLNETGEGGQTANYGRLYSDKFNNHLVVSGQRKTVKFETLLYTVGSSLPDGYTPDFEFSESDNLKFITTQNIHNFLPTNTGGDTSKLDNRLKVLEAKNWEIHGRGMPNGVVSAPVGTTYVDEAVTNGALKWIKKSGTGNTGWEVLIGDTGWKVLPSVSKLGGSYVKVRRVNNVVSYQFGGLSWGWFGIVRRGGAGYQVQPSDRERNCFILGLSGIPIGYRSEASLIGGIYNDKGTPYGTWYLGGVGDGNMLRFQFTDPVPTDRDIGDIRVSSISYLTSDLWPQN